MKLEEIGYAKKQINALNKKNIRTSEDLVLYLPKRYKDYRTLSLITSAEEDRFGAFNGELVFCDKRAGKKWYIFLKVLQDDGTTFNVMYFSEMFRYKTYQSLLHKRVVVCGKPSYDETYGWSLKYPEVMIAEEEYKPHIAPVYTKIEGLSEEALEKGIQSAISQTEEPLCEEMLGKTKLPYYKDALRFVHFPQNTEELASGKRRLLFNDMFYFADALGKAETHGTETTDIILKKEEKIKELEANLPYDLTEDQKKVLQHFRHQAANGQRFNVLIQGDVGCGKTVVAMSMMANACENGYQCVLMAPREVLAKQHFDEVEKTMKALGFSSVFLSSSLTGKKKAEITEKIKNGEIDIIVGTHSCIASSVEYRALGLIVTDEEHLFGVRQKELLEAKADLGVHAISMSATPIPRSLATILYGDKKEIMVIKTMPKGRKPVQTAAQRSHANVFPFMEKQIREGRQCYVVCPAIEQNEEYDIVSVEEMEKAYRSYFEPKGISLKVVHGQMKTAEIEETIQSFTKGETDILMSTTVIEVGVNVPNTTVMVIEQANRFGLASLHQLRGRVGRSDMQSYCILIANDIANPRIQTMVSTNDGFEIAEADLKQRGSGDLLGVRQSGNNRFVNEMIKHPSVFQCAVNSVRYCKEHHLMNHLDTIYGENAESVGEE